MDFVKPMVERNPSRRDPSRSEARVHTLLQTSHESRTETLRTCSIIWCSFPYNPARKWPIYLRPSEDTVYVNLDAITWFEYIVRRYPKVFAQVRRVTAIIPEVHVCGSIFWAKMKENISRTETSPLVGGQAQRSFPRLSLENFPGLKHLELRAPYYYEHDGNITNWKRTLRCWVDRWYAKTAPVDFLVPGEIVVVATSKRSGRGLPQRHRSLIR